MDNRGLPPIFLTTVTLLIAFCVWSIGISLAADQGYVGDSLSTALISRSKKTNEQFIVTKKALIKERMVGTKSFLDSESKSMVIWGWTLIYLPEENPSSILRLAEKNQNTWEPLLKGPPPGRKNIASSMFPGIDAAVTNRIFSEICGTYLELGFTQRVYLFISFNGGIPNKDLCRGYMLLLAANNIAVSRTDRRIIAYILSD